MQGRRLGHAALLILIVATVGCDHVTKRYASATLAGTPGRSYLADTVRLQYAENPGGFLSLGADLPPVVRTGVLTVGAGLALIAMVITAVRHRWTGLPLAGVALVLAGGLSNLTDRIVRGTVVDFLTVGLGPLRTGIFNVADVAVMAGVCLLVFASVQSDQVDSWVPPAGGGGSSDDPSGCPSTALGAPRADRDG